MVTKNGRRRSARRARPPIPGIRFLLYKFGFCAPGKRVEGTRPVDRASEHATLSAHALPLGRPDAVAQATQVTYRQTNPSDTQARRASTVAPNHARPHNRNEQLTSTISGRTPSNIPSVQTDHANAVHAPCSTSRDHTQTHTTRPQHGGSSVVSRSAHRTQLIHRAAAAVPTPSYRALTDVHRRRPMRATPPQVYRAGRATSPYKRVNVRIDGSLRTDAAGLPGVRDFPRRSSRCARCACARRARSPAYTWYAAPSSAGSGFTCNTRVQHGTAPRPTRKGAKRLLDCRGGSQSHPAPLEVGKEVLVALVNRLRGSLH